MKILFYAINGVGLGHLNRLLLVAKAIKKLNRKTSIFFITNSGFTALIKKNNFPLLKIKENWEPIGEKTSFAVKKIIDSRNIGAIVYDTHFNFSLFNIFKERNVKNILILRETDNMRPSKFISEYYKDFDLILVPHAREELRSRGKTNLLMGNLRSFKKIKFIGPIVQEKPTRKINLGKNKFNILATCGGGGQDKNNTGIDDFLAMIKSASKILAKKIENLNLIVVTGPLYKGKFNINIKGVVIKKYQRNLLGMMEVADLVISSAGYNICNEIIAAKAPSILVPLKRFQESQSRRAKRLGKKRVALVLRGFCSKILIKKVLDLYKNPAKLRRMRKNFDKIKLKRGNKIAAKMILDLL